MLMSCGINEYIKNVQFVTCTLHLDTEQLFFWTVGIDGVHSEIPAFKNCFNKLVYQGVVQLGKLYSFRKGVKEICVLADAISVCQTCAPKLDWLSNWSWCYCLQMNVNS